ncbi:MAG TPA: thiamine phosphate synthase [Candidatus Acidoferrum sp.]|nr:thiamine phosphate synthase [Candidatus Acidoferrum sp.]
MKSIDACRLYTFVDTAYLHGRTPADVARALCDGGSDIVQLRAKGAAIQDIRRIAEAILPVTRAAKVPLVINDFPELAAELRAEMVHLGQEDFFDAGFTHRSQLAALHSHLGLSSHAPEQAQRAITAGADYIAIGPVFATGTKPGRAAVTLDYVRWAAANVMIPWFAIGGIALNNLDEVLAAGARRICVVSAILNAPDIARACHDFKQRLSSAPL